MADLFETLKEIIGDEEKAKKAQSALGEFMLPRAEYNKVAEKLKAKDEELEKIKLANMDQSQLLEHELNKAKALQSEFSVKTNRLEAEKLFVGAGLTSEQYSKLLDSSVSEDKEKTLSLVNGFIEILGKEKESVASKTKESLINQTKKPETGEETKPEQSPKVRTSL